MDAGDYLKQGGFWLAWMVADAVTAAGKEAFYDYEAKARAMAHDAEHDREAGRS